MKLISLFIAAVLAVNKDGHVCKKIEAGNWNLTIAGEAGTEPYEDRKTCIQAKCTAMAAQMPTDPEEDEYWKWMKKNRCNSHYHTCNAKKYWLGPCGEYRDCQAQQLENGDRTCIPQKCKFRTSSEPTDPTADCTCGKNTKCMCKKDGVCTASFSKRHVYCFQTDKTLRLSYAEQKLANGWKKYGSNYWYWLGQHLGQADGNCTWSGDNEAGRNHPTTSHKNPVKWYSFGDDGLCCRNRYELRCSNPNGRLVQFNGDECECLVGFTRSVAEGQDGKKWKKVYCKFDGRPVKADGSGGDGSGGTYQVAASDEGADSDEDNGL